MDTWSELLLAWLEGEGERQKRQTPLPPRVGDPAVRGWVHVGVGVLGGTLAAGLFVCWLVRMGAGTARMAQRSFGVGRIVTLEGVPVERIAWDVEAQDWLGPRILIVRYKGRLLVCEFRKETAPRDVRVGDVVTIRSATGLVEERGGRSLLGDCEVVEWVFRPKE